MDKSRYEGNYMKNYDKTVKSKSIYEQYRQRIEKGKYGKVEKSREELKNPEVKKLCEKSKQIS